MSAPTVFLIKKGALSTKRRLLTILLLLLLLCGCGGGAEDAALPVLVIGSDDYAPYSYLDSDGFAGFDVELAEEACRRLGYAPEFRRIAWEQKDTLLQSGEIDCLWGCFTMTGRETLYCWAGPYAKSRQMVAVRTESGIKNLAGLAGRRVAVQMTGKPEELFLTRPSENIPDVAAVYSFSSSAEIYAALRKDYVDAVAAHENALRTFVSGMPDSIVMLSEPLFVSELGVAFAKDAGREELAENLTETLLAMEAEGFTAALAEKYGLAAAEG